MTGMLAKLKELAWKRLVLLVAFAVLVGSTLVYYYTHGHEGVLTSLVNVVAGAAIPASLLGVLWESFLKVGFLDLVKAKVDDTVGNVHNEFKNELTEDIKGLLKAFLDDFVLLQLCKNYGIRGFYRTRMDIDLHKYIRTARTRIRVLLTSFSYLTETGIADEIAKKAQTVKIEILGLAPNTSGAMAREAFSEKYKSLNQEIPTYMSALTDTLGDSEGQQVHVRLYDKMPTCACFFIDSDLFVCSLLCSKRGRRTVHLHINEHTDSNEESPIFREFREHFEKLLEKRNSVPLEEYSQPRSILPDGQREG